MHYPTFIVSMLFAISFVAAGMLVYLRNRRLGRTT